MTSVVCGWHWYHRSATAALDIVRHCLKFSDAARMCRVRGSYHHEIADCTFSEIFQLHFKSSEIVDLTSWLQLTVFTVM